MQAGWPSRGKKAAVFGISSPQGRVLWPGHLRLEDGHPMRRCVVFIRRNDAMMPSGIAAKSATQRKLRNDGVTALLLSFAAEGELEMTKYQASVRLPRAQPPRRVLRQTLLGIEGGWPSDQMILRSRNSSSTRSAAASGEMPTVATLISGASGGS